VERILITGALCSRSRLEATAATDLSAWLATLEVLRDLEPALVVPGNGEPGGPELIEAQIDRIVSLRRLIEDALLAGSSAEDIIRGMKVAWFIAWHDEDPQAANAALSAVINELGGLTTPWELIEDRRLREGASPTRDDDGWTPPKKVLWRNRWPERLPLLDQVAPGVEIIAFDSADEAMEFVADADAIIGTATPGLLAAGENLRWVQVGAAGVERYLKIPELGSGAVLLTNGQRLASEVIGEHAMAMTRALSRGLNRAVEAQVEGQWRRTEIGDNAPLTKLRGKTLLVVGLGGIGTEVARLADAAGMRVTAIRSSRRSGPPFVASVGLTEDLATYVAEADVVVNCLPMTPDTEDVFSAELFSVMKETAFFINVGRGGTVDTDALVAALNDGAIAGAGLDVTDPEPLPEGHPLWQAPNLIITPHFAAWSDAGRELQWLLFRENLRRFVVGEHLLSVVDPERGY
jgi:D-2-hydroxyacid dehydrogenase (NADP+)